MERNSARSGSASPESIRPSVYSEAFQVWKAARELFTTALKAYADASTALEAICVGNQASSKAARTEMEKVLMALEPELQQISLDVKQVTKTTKTLKVLRNQSATLVPISRLPPKVFMRIFQSLMHLDPQDPALQTGFWPFPETVAHVCSSWRQVSFDDSQLWGRVGINISKAQGARSYKEARARLEYARDSRLDVRIYQDNPLSVFHTERAIEFFDQIAPRLGAISCRSFDYWHKNLMADILVSWLQHGTFYTLSELHLFSYRNSQSSRDLRQDLAKNLSIAALDGWLSSVRYLTLHHVFIDWSSEVYHNLVELSLLFDEHGYNRAPIEQFMGALSVSPMLRVLKLCGLQLSSQSAPSGLEPVRLEKLEVFFLKNIESDTIEVLLPLLQPGPTPIYMTFGLNKDCFGLGSYIGSYIPFLRRSPIARLMVRGFAGGVLPELCTVLSITQHLVLDGFLLDMNFFLGMKLPLARNRNILYPTVRPHLRTLHLVRCSFSHDFTQERGRLKKPIPYDFMMWLSDCRLWGKQDIQPLNIGSKSKAAQEVLQAVTSYVPGMQGAFESDSPFLTDAWKSALDFSADTHHDPGFYGTIPYDPRKPVEH